MAERRCQSSDTNTLNVPTREPVAFANGRTWRALGCEGLGRLRPGSLALVLGRWNGFFSCRCGCLVDPTPKAFGRSPGCPKLGYRRRVGVRGGGALSAARALSCGAGLDPVLTSESCASALPALPALPSVYALRPPGRGGMGEVYRSMTKSRSMKSTLILKTSNGKL